VLWFGDKSIMLGYKLKERGTAVVPGQKLFCGKISNNLLFSYIKKSKKPS
jgi:alanine-alpha-ketoisovalerate/valine-pyruvate aminotransferase